MRGYHTPQRTRLTSDDSAQHSDQFVLQVSPIDIAVDTMPKRDPLTPHLYLHFVIGHEVSNTGLPCDSLIN
jgi:hypothetical protein